MENKQVTVSSAGSPALVESVLIQGDLSNLPVEQRLSYYKAVCESVGLNPLTKPFEYIQLNGKLCLYARRDATDQLRKIHGVSIIQMEEKVISDIYVVTATAKDKTGRTDIAKGAISVAGLNGEKLANAMMKCETKAKRRVTLSLCGLGLLDETEVESVQQVQIEQEQATARVSGFWYNIELIEEMDKQEKAEEYARANGANYDEEWNLWHSDIELPKLKKCFIGHNRPAVVGDNKEGE
jgi:hypothetical protein